MLELWPNHVLSNVKELRCLGRIDWKDMNFGVCGRAKLSGIDTVREMTVEKLIIFFWVAFAVRRWCGIGVRSATWVRCEDQKKENFVKSNV